MNTEKCNKVSWKSKLLAFLHDPPSKALDIPAHKETARNWLIQAGFTEDEIEQFDSQSDWAASAADRLPFPASQPSGLACHFDGVRNCFHHPLGAMNGLAGTLPFSGEFVTAEFAQSIEQSVQPAIDEGGFGTLPADVKDPSGERWRAQFFAHWRLWPKHATERDCRFGFLPADTRIPDHTIWNHMQIVSALAGCADPTDPSASIRPAFLRVQIGPVQDFIAQARSIRDLWSGSYLLSWLMAAGLKALSAEVGPDAVVFPSLRGQPLFDLHWRDDLWTRIRIAKGSVTVWESLGWNSKDQLMPSLPNVLLAVVPQERAEELGRMVTQAIQDEWRRIAAAVWKYCNAAGLTADEAAISEKDRKSRYDAQIDRFLSLSWQATPWPETLQECLELAEGFSTDMPITKASERVRNIITMATSQMVEQHRDKRYYTTEAKTELNNPGLGWSVILAANQWALDAVRQTRNFAAANVGGWKTGTCHQKDSLNGRDEMVAGGREWIKRAEKQGGCWSVLFKHDDWLGAAMLTKRVWHLAYLHEVWGLKTDSQAFPMPNTRGIAEGRPHENAGDDETAESAPNGEKYFAVLALDGDEMGKWVSGENAPLISSQLADYADGSGNRLGSRVYFEKENFKGFLTSKRPVSPGYHLQFSEALSNFALVCAKPVVEAFEGRLIYAGGDDVLALVPAQNALECAAALRDAFTGREVFGPNRTPIFESPAPGFLTAPGRVDGMNRPIPFLVPGPATDCSVGIAIAHFKSPLQDVIHQARMAEKRAKADLKRGAVAVNLLKHSGEIIHWGCRWDSGGLEAYRKLSAALEAEQLSSKFPHRLVELLEPYVNQKSGLTTMSSVKGFNEQLLGVVSAEIQIVLERQKGVKSLPRAEEEALQEALRNYATQLPATEDRLGGLIGLCQTVAFAHRTR
jgi:CRISPR-associated protein Cas10/Cmr2 subtype III-B